MSDDEERNQIVRGLSGDTEVLGTWRGWVKQVLRIHAKGLSGPDFEDLEQEVLTAVIGNLREERFVGASSLKTYVQRIGHYRAIDRLRSARAKPLGINIDRVEEELVSDEPSAAVRIEVQEAGRLAMRVFAEMPDHCRQIWTMIVAGHSYVEIAERLGVRPGTVRVRALRCREAASKVRARIERLELGKERGSRG